MAVDVEKARDAKMLIDHPLVNEIFDALEREAMSAAINAAPLEHDLRAARMAEIRAIRSLRQRLRLLVAESAALTPRT